jgi:polar amino acid transport system permease protein
VNTGAGAKASSMAAFFDIVTRWGPSLLRGALNTLALVGLCFPLTLILCIVIGLARLSQVWLVRAVARVYVEVFRGVSLFVTIFWLYFVLPFLGVSLSPWGAAVSALVLVHAAYASEYVRSTVQDVPKAQYQAAQALDMSRFHIMRYVIFPQAIAAIMPLLGNELVLLLKGTSIASLISVAELTGVGRAIIMSTSQSFPTLTAVLLTYFAMAQILSWGSRRLERRFARWRSVAELDRYAKSRSMAQLWSRRAKVRA